MPALAGDVIAFHARHEFRNDLTCLRTRSGMPSLSGGVISFHEIAFHESRALGALAGLTLGAGTLSRSTRSRSMRHEFRREFRAAGDGAPSARHT